MKEPPFYSWECLTISLKNRDVDLVIKNQEEMNRLVKYLLYRINSVDGNKNSAQPIIDSNPNEDVFKLKHEISIKTMTRIKIMRIRQKISYIAFTKKMTLAELIYT